MAQHRNHTESAAKVAGDVAAAEKPMDRFRSLARRLVRVPRSEFEQERRKREKAKTDDAPT
jgi:hypothetical protein